MGPEAGTTQVLYSVYNGERTYFALYQHRPGKIDYTSAFDDVMQHWFWLTPWTSYRSDRSGYTVDYPASWYALGTLGAPDSNRYFANRADVSSPLGMDAGGAFLRINADTGPCVAPPRVAVDGTAQLRVGGQSVARITGFVGSAQNADGEGFWAAYADVPVTGGCFEISFIFGGKAARDANLRTADQIVGSFTTA
jgi:hypothetical protein